MFAYRGQLRKLSMRMRLRYSIIGAIFIAAASSVRAGVPVRLTVDESASSGFVQVVLGNQYTGYNGNHTFPIRGSMDVDYDLIGRMLTITGFNVEPIITGPGLPTLTILVAVPPIADVSVAMENLSCRLEAGAHIQGPTSVDSLGGWSMENQPLSVASRVRYEAMGLECNRLLDAGSVCVLDVQLDVSGSMPQCRWIDGNIIFDGTLLGLSGRVEMRVPLDAARPWIGSMFILMRVQAAGVVRTLCRSDFDLDGDTDVSDIFAFLSAWFTEFGSCTSACSADIDGDQNVIVSDIFAFLNFWFADFGQPCN